MSLIDADRRVLVLALARLTEAAGNSFVIILLPLYLASSEVGGARFGLTVAFISGLALSVAGITSSLAQPLTGRLSDRLGRRKAFISGGLAVRVVTTAAYTLAHAYPVVLLVRLAHGFGSSFTIPTTVALINEYATTATRGENMGVYTSFRLIGSGIGPVVAGLVNAGGPYDVPVLGTLTGFETAFGLAALGALASFLLVHVYVADPPETEPLSGDGVSVTVVGGRGLNPVFVLSVAAVFFGMNVSLISAIQPQVNARLGQTSAWFGAQYAALLVALFVLSVPFGRASDRYGRRPFLLAAGVVLVPVTASLGFLHTSLGFLLARAGQGVALAMAVAPAVALVGDVADGDSGTKLSFLTMSFGLGAATGPLLSGALVAYGFAVPFLAAAVLAVAPFVMVYREVDETLDGEATAVPSS